MDTVNPERYHLTLTASGRPVLHGWWGDEAVARGKFTSLVGEQGRDGGRVTLVDEETGETLDSWPGVVGGGS